MANNLTLRILSALFTGAVSIFCVLQGGIVFFLLMLAILWLMLYEWWKINKDKKSSLYIFGNVYLIIPIVYWMLNWNIGNIMWILGIVWSCDIFAFIGGKIFKGPKLAPNISPNKTWSGVIVGSIAAFVFSYFYQYTSYFKTLSLDLVAIEASIINFKFFAGTIVVIIASILGDLLESKVKRILGVKDTGNIIPGHGGICDRLDSFLLATYALMIINLVTLFFS